MRSSKPIRSEPTGRAGRRTRAAAVSKGMVVLGALAVASAASAATEIDPFALSPEQLFDATVMSVSKTDEKLRDAPAAIYVLTSEDIARSGATSIMEALRLAPGVQVARGNSSFYAISVRGLNSILANKLLVLIDGRETYDPLFAGVYWDIQDTALEDVDRVEVIRGPGASLWGANAVNGVINIITKKDAQTQGALVSVVAGDQDRAIVTGRIGAQADEGAHWRVFAKYLYRASQERLSGADAEDQGRAWRGGFRADWDANAQGDSFTLQGDVYTSNAGRFRAFPLLTAPYVSVFAENVAAQGGNVSGRWNRSLDDGASLNVHAYFDLVARQQPQGESDRRIFDLEVQYGFPASDAHEIIAGAHYRVWFERLTPSAVIEFIDRTPIRQLISGFVQDKITLEPERWFLTVGSKFEHNDYSGFEMQPSARLQWTGDDQTMWGSVSRAVRTPSELEHNLHVTYRVIPPGVDPISVERYPNTDFESEELIAYEIGYRRQWTPSLLMDVAAFYNVYDKLSTSTLLPNEVVLVPPHVVSPFISTNLTSGETFGAELVLNWRADETLNFSAAYSLLEIALQGPPASQATAAEAAEDQSPQQQFNLRAQWDVSDELTFDTTLYYVDELPGYAVPSYWRFDARAGWRITDELQLEVVGQNLFDDAHREFSGVTDVTATEIQRAVYGRLTWRS
jgi:iron complex outermembrane receptor protein